MPHVVYNPKQAERPAGAPEGWTPPAELHALAEGIRFTFPAFKAQQISDEQWRFLNAKGAPGAGLSLLSVDDDMVAEILERRAAALAPAPAPDAGAAPPASAAPPPGPAPPTVEPVPPTQTLVARAETLRNFPKLAAFARKHLPGEEVPRDRAGILAALARKDAEAAGV